MAKMKFSVKKLNVFTPIRLAMLLALLVILQALGVAFIDKTAWMIGSLRVTYGVIGMVVLIAAVLIDARK